VITMDILEKVQKVLQTHYICDHCLGRQFAQLLSGFSNDQRGKALRTTFAMQRDASGVNVNPLNLVEFEFRQKGLELPKSGAKCNLCHDIFKRIAGIAFEVDKDVKKRKLEFNSFLVGSKPPADLLHREEELWEEIGAEGAEPLKAELNRELGKRLEKLWNIGADMKNPDLMIVYDFTQNKPVFTVNPLYIYGEYQKLKRGIPQTKWPSGKYKISVEQIIAKPFMRATHGKEHKFHGMGREDIDALCLAWRPFVLEIVEPVRRKVDLNAIIKHVNRDKRVKVKSMKFTTGKTVEKIKLAKPDKSYRALVVLDKAVKPAQLKELKKIVGHVKQKTPERVLHRRADLVRTRKVKELKVKRLGPKRLEVFVTAEAGTYIKELVSGDQGRSKPSFSEILGIRAKVKELDVVKIHN
jgi:tRNA pseudouridine synthase 10